MLNYFFFRISCHSIWPISHLYTISIDRCAFLYALITDAPMSFPTLFFPVFIHRILLDLGLKVFPTSEPVHIIASIGATFLQQKAAQLKASSKCPRVKSSTGASRPPTSGDSTVEEFVDPTTVIEPPVSSSSNACIRSMLDTIMTI